MRQMRTDDSSNVASVSWVNGKMEVEFTSGAAYLYGNVQQHQFAEACGAPSVGKWVVSTLVKNPGAYPCVKLREGSKLASDKLRTALQLIASCVAGDGGYTHAQAEDMVAAAKAALE